MLWRLFGDMVTWPSTMLRLGRCMELGCDNKQARKQPAASELTTWPVAGLLLLLEFLFLLLLACFLSLLLLLRIVL